MGAIPYEACLEALPIGTIVVDQKGGILYANVAARRFAPGSTDSQGLAVRLPFLRSLPGGDKPFTVPLGSDGSTDRRELRVQVRSVPTGECRLVLLEETESPGSSSVFDIVSSVRHEINNSLMGLLGQVELLLERTDLSETARRKVSRVQAEAERIRQRVADLNQVRKQ